MPLLKMLRGPEPGREYELTEETITIGRGRLNNIIIQDNEVSREHCRLVRVLDDYEIFDLGSTNNTYVDGRPLSEGNGWMLGSRHIIELGYSITLEYMPSEIVTSTQIPKLAPEDAEPEKFYLVVQSASNAEYEIYDLDMNIISLGRDLSNDIVLPESEVSRHHLCLLRIENGYALEDLNTMNGTSVNEQWYQNGQVPLPLNAKIRIGTQVTMWYTNDPHFNPDTPYAPDAQIPTDSPLPPATATVTAANQVIENGEANGEMTRIGSGLQPNDLEGYIFLVYSRDDWEPFVMYLYEYLRRNGVSTWIDQNLAPDSKDWTAAVDQAQTECKALVVVLSEEALKTPYVERSIRRFHMLDKPILLLRYKDIERLPIKSVPTIKYSPTNPQRSFRTLIAEIKRLDQFGAS